MSVPRTIGGGRISRRVRPRRYQIERLEERQMLSATPLAQDDLFTVSQGGQLDIGPVAALAREEWGVRVNPTAPRDYELTVSHGQTVQSGGSFTMGNLAGTVGEARVTGAGSTWEVSQWIEVGRNGYGRVIVDNGARWSTGNWVDVGSSDAPGYGEVIVRGPGSRWENANYMAIGSSQGRGRLVIADGGMASAGQWRATVGGEGTGEVLILGEGSQWSVGQLSLGHSGSGTIRVAESGRFISDSVDVGNGGRLLGDGTFRGNIQNGGVIGPGSAHGTMRLEGTLTLPSTSTVELHIAGVERGATYGALDVTGNITYGGKLVVNFVNGFAPRAGDEFELIRGNAGSFGQVQINGLAAGFQCTVTHSDGAIRLRALSDGVAVAAPAISGLLANDSDADADKLGVQLVERPTDGTLSLFENGSLRYTPNPGFVGHDTFRYRATDGFHESEVATVTIEVDGPAPIATADAYQMDEGSALTVSAANGLLANDTTASGATLSATRTLAASHGAVDVNADGSFTYTPQPDFVGTDTFRYRATDGAAQSNIAIVTITVNAVNDPPAAVGETYLATQDTPLVVSTATVGPRIYQTTTNPSLGGYGGSSISATQFLGTRFQVTAPTTTGRIGGVFGGTGTAFAALVALSGPDDVPDSFDLSTPDLLGHSIFALPGGSGLLVSAALEIPLSPGWYAAVFGTTLFGAQGEGYSTDSGDGGAELFWAQRQWTDGSFRWNSQPDRGNHFFIDALGTPTGLLANDRDPEYSSLAAVLESGPEHGTLNLAADGTFTYTPNPGFFGTDSFSYRATDGSAASAVIPVSIIVRSDILPVAASDAFAIDEDVNLVVAADQGLLANDSGRAATAQLVTGPTDGTLALAPDGSFVYSPRPEFSGIDRFWYRLQTADGLSAPAVLTITVNRVIDPPVVMDDIYRFDADTELRAGYGQISAQHIFFSGSQKLQRVGLDGSNVETQFVPPGGGMGALAIDASNGWLYWYSLSAEYTIYRTRFDGSQRRTVFVSQQVTVGGQTDHPYVSDLALDVAGGKLYWSTLGPGGSNGKIWRANLDGSGATPIVTGQHYPYSLDLDLLHGKVYWADRSTHNIQRANLDGSQVEAVVRTTAEPIALALDVAGGAMYWFQGQYFGDNTLYRARLDGSQAEALVGIPHSSPTDLVFEPIEGKLYWGDGEVRRVNRDGSSLEVVADDHANGVGHVALDQAFGSGYTNNLLANDRYDPPSDDPEDYVTVELVTGPSHGSLTLNADGTFDYVPNEGFQGNDSFTYRVLAGGLVSEPATARLSIIREVDIPAVANAEEYSIDEDTQLVVAGLGVLANDTDAEQDPLSAQLVSPPAHATLDLDESGSFTYTPAANYFGADAFSYRAFDGYEYSSPTTVTITVRPVDDAPMAQSDQFYVAADTARRVTRTSEGLLANDSDGDGDALVAEIVATPSHGSLTLNANGTFTYQPEAGYVGSDGYSYRAVDSSLASEPATVHLIVHAPRSVGGLVWDDTNTDGRQGDDEPGMPGITVRLLDSDETVLSSVVTDNDGRYAHTGLAIGETYFVEMLAPEGRSFTRKDAGGDDGLDSDILRATGRAEFALGLSQHSRQIDAGLVQGVGSNDVDQFLRISELLFIGHGHAEFIELTNIGTTPLDLSGVRFTDGVTFDFTGSGAATLFPGEFIVVVGDAGLFNQIYPSSNITVAGQFSGRLNQEERLTLVGPLDEPILDFVYDDDWFAVTDDEFAPFSINALDLHADPQSWDSVRNWRPSSLAGGSPGSDDPRLTRDPGSVVINEIMANPEDGQRDWLELHNTTDHEIDIGYWFLGDGRGYNAMQYQIPGGTIIPAGGYLVFNRDDSFQFGLSGSGESVYLIGGNAARQALGYSEGAEDYPASPHGVTLGRVVAADGDVDYVPLTAPTPGAANASPVIGPLVFNEVMYRPSSFGDEFIEIYNVSSQPVTLDGWSLGTVVVDPHGRDTEAILVTFPEGVTIAPGGYALVVSILPETFRATYHVPDTVPIVAPLTGSLSDDTQTLRLLMIDASGDTLPVDELRYETLAPWPVEASMGGRSLERTAPTEYGNEPSHWHASMAIGGTPGTSNTTIAPRPDGDFNGDFSVDSVDIDLICIHLANPAYTTGHYATAGTSVMFDLTSDRLFNTADVDTLITTILGTAYGDVDLDGRVGLGDLMILRRNFGQTTGMNWASGDMTGDGRVDRADLALLSANFGHRSISAPDAAVSVVATSRTRAAAVDQALSVEAPPARRSSLAATRALRGVSAVDSVASESTVSSQSITASRRVGTRARGRDELPV